MKVSYDEIAPLPEMIQKMEVLHVGKGKVQTVTMSEEEKNIVEALLKGGTEQAPELLSIFSQSEAHGI